MSDVPKFVRQRAAQQAAGDHPDANLLAGFAEGGLTKGERAQVLMHLGACAACREVVALSLPETPAEVPAPEAATQQWLRWPVLRWAGAVAAVIVVAAAVVVMKPHRTVTEPMKQAVVTDSAEKPAAPKPPETPAAAAVGAPPRNDEMRAKTSSPVIGGKEELKARASKKEDAAASYAFKDAPSSRDLNRAKSNEVAQAQDHAEADRVQSQLRAGPAKLQSDAPAESAKVQSQVPAASPAAAPAASGQVAGLTAEQSRQQQSNAPQSQAAIRDENQANAAHSKAALGRPMTQSRPEPQAVESVEVTAAAPPGRSKKTVLAPLAKTALATANVRWRVSSEGAVERSIDGGRTWLSMRLDAKPAIFRSVSSVDHEVWAGGTGGALYHSTDDGRTWTPVKVQAFDMVLATDIARVEFTDSQHGYVTTTTGVTWTTSDAGATWSVRAKPRL
jgi:hypothetical protein